jgi:hypothetical protein
MVPFLDRLGPCCFASRVRPPSIQHQRRPAPANERRLFHACCPTRQLLRSAGPLDYLSRTRRQNLQVRSRSRRSLSIRFRTRCNLDVLGFANFRERVLSSLCKLTWPTFCSGARQTHHACRARNRPEIEAFSRNSTLLPDDAPV